MNADERRFEHLELTRKTIGVFYDVYNELGHGFLEAVYQKAMLIALNEAGIRAEERVPVPVWFRGQQIGEYWPDLFVDATLILELKAVSAIEPAHEAQLLHYLRATQIEVGLVLNFGPKPGIKRLAFSNDRKHHLRSSA